MIYNSNVGCLGIIFNSFCFLDVSLGKMDAYQACLSANGPAIAAAVIFPITIIITIVTAVLTRKLFRSGPWAFRIEQKILMNLIVANLMISLTCLTLVVAGKYIWKDTSACSTIRKVGDIVVLSTYCCIFLSYASMNLNRFLSCFVPLQYTNIVTERRLMVLFLFKWVFSYSVITTSVLLFKNSRDDGLLLTLHTEATYGFIVIYFISVIVVFVVNIWLWFLGHKKHKLAVTQTSSGRRNDDKLSNRKKFKTVIITFSFTVKNILCFLPFICVILSEPKGISTTEKLSIVGPLTALSPLLDPFLYLVINRKARLRVGNSINSRKRKQKKLPNQP